MKLDTRKIMLVDIDGTLVDNTHRRHLVPARHLASDPVNWMAFNGACGGDAPLEHNIHLVKMLIAAGTLPVFLTSRGAAARQVTTDQLKSLGLRPHPLIMRRMTDRRPAWEYKTAIAGMLQKYYGRKIWLAIDDDPQVCRALENIGIDVIQVESACAHVQMR